MEVLPFDAEIHRDLIREWLLAHGLNSDDADQLPKLGFLIRDQDGFISAGFLRRVEAGYAILDGLIANPTSAGKRRYHAIDFLVEALIQKARELGLKQLFATSKDNATLKRSVRHGFTSIQQTIIGMQL